MAHHHLQMSRNISMGFFGSFSIHKITSSRCHRVGEITKQNGLSECDYSEQGCIGSYYKTKTMTDSVILGSKRDRMEQLSSRDLNIMPHITSHLLVGINALYTASSLLAYDETHVGLIGIQWRME